jgi:hypothetical protein
VTGPLNNLSQFRQQKRTQFLPQHVVMVRGGHGLHKVSCGPAMPYSSTPCGWATPETAPSGLARPQSRQPATIFYPFEHPTPCDCVFISDFPLILTHQSSLSRLPSDASMVITVASMSPMHLRNVGFHCFHCLPLLAGRQPNHQS